MLEATTDRQRSNSVLLAIVVAFALSLESTGQAAPITFQFETLVDARQFGGPASTPLQFTYTFDSELADGTGPLPGRLGVGSYGPIDGTMNFLGESFALPLASGIVIENDGSLSFTEDSYRAAASGANIAIASVDYVRVEFTFGLADFQRTMFTDTSLPLTPWFVPAVDRVAITLQGDRAGGSFARAFDATRDFSLVVVDQLIPEPSPAWLMVAGMLGLAVRRPSGYVNQTKARPQLKARGGITS